MGLILDESCIAVNFGVDRRRPITSGRPTGKIRANGIPEGESLEYFNVDEYPEIKAHYGNQPDKLVIYFPSNILEHFFTYRRVTWGSNHKTKRVCDGKKFFVRFKQQDEKGNDGPYGNGRIYEPGNDYECQWPKCECRHDVQFYAFIANPVTGGIITNNQIRFKTTSKNNGDHIWTQLKLRQKILLGLPWVIWVEVGYNGEKKCTFWKLEPGKHRNAMLAGASDLGDIAPLEITDGNIPLEITEGKPTLEIKSSGKDVNKLIKVKELIGKITNKDEYESMRIELNNSNGTYSKEEKKVIKFYMTEKTKELEKISVDDLLGSGISESRYVEHRDAKNANGKSEKPYTTKGTEEIDINDYVL